MTRLKYYFEGLVYFIVFFGVAIFQVSFISSLPRAYSAMNFPLIFLLFSLLFLNREKTLSLAIFLGFCLDILSFNFFGLNIFVYLSTMFILDLLLNNWLTNRSLYSFLVLSIIGVLLYNFLFYFVLAGFQSYQSGFSLFLLQSNFWLQLLWQMFWSFVFMLLFFNLANSLSKHLKPFFLEKK